MDRAAVSNFEARANERRRFSLTAQAIALVTGALTLSFLVGVVPLAVLADQASSDLFSLLIFIPFAAVGMIVATGCRGPDRLETASFKQLS
jgi:hypothetical protein